MAGAELNDDMISIKKETITVMTPEGGTLQDYAYREAAYVFLSQRALLFHVVGRRYRLSLIIM